MTQAGETNAKGVRVRHLQLDGREKQLGVAAAWRRTLERPLACWEADGLQGGRPGCRDLVGAASMQGGDKGLDLAVGIQMARGGS